MDCAIWLNKRKIFSADEISENFDIAAVRGYFLGGSLIKWLNAHGGEDYARALSALNPADPALNDRLTEIFIQKKCEAPVHKADENLILAVNMLRSGGNVTGSAVSSLGGSFGSFAYNFGSFSTTSFSRTSFSKTWQWEWEWRFGSFRGGSTSFGGSYRLGSFSLGSFGGNFGSYNLGSFRRANFGALPMAMLPSSYRGVPLGSRHAMTADEYDEIMYRCLNMCPLNRFGYGIHNI